MFKALLHHRARLARLSPASTRISPRSFSSKLYNFSKSNEDPDRLPAPKGKVKPWLNIKLPTQKRLEAFLSTIEIHPHDYRCREMLDLITQCCKKKSIEGVQEGQQVIDRLLLEKQRYKEKNIDVFIHERMWSSVLYGWANLVQQRPVALFRMKDTLDACIQQAKKDHEDDSNAPSQPSVEIFNTYIRGLAFAAKRKANAAIMAEEIIQTMLQLQESHNWHTKPNQRTYTYVLEALCNSRHPSAGQRAVSILQQVKEAQRKGAHEYQVKYEQPYNFQDPDPSLQRIVTADSVIYTLVVKALMFSADGIDDILRVFADMLSVNDGSLQMDSILFTTIIQAIGRQVGQLKTREEKIDLLEKARAILNAMIERADGGDWKPIYGFNALIDAWSRSDFEDAGPGAQAVLEEMLESDIVQPNTVSFNTCLMAWSRSAKYRKDAIEHIEEILSRQQEYAVENPACSPDFLSYSAAANALSDNVVAARKWLVSVMRLWELGKIAESGTPSALFAAVLQAAARAPVQREASDGDDFGESVEDDAFEIAIQTFEEIDQDVFDLGAKPNHHVYAAYIACLAKYAKTDKDVQIGDIFLKASKAGEISRLVVKVVNEAKAELLPKDGNDNLQLPRYWDRNVDSEWRYRPSRVSAKST